MDLKGSLVDTKLKIYPSDKLLEFIKIITVDNETPKNIIKLAKPKINTQKKDFESKFTQCSKIYLDSFETEKMNNIRKFLKNNRKISVLKPEKKIEDNDTKDNIDSNGHNADAKDETLSEGADDKEKHTKNKNDLNHEEKSDKTTEPENKSKPAKEFQDRLYLTTSDIDWLYDYIHEQKNAGKKDIPYLHTLLQDSHVETPENTKIKRNPELEARCVKLRAQQEAREYRKMTRGVDNVRMRYPEDTIAYQLKSLNRQLIAIGQFILSIFAGFLFGFRGVELMIGELDFGFRLLLGVMCALIIALAEIYFLAKKLNEELQLSETVQIGGPPKFADSPIFTSLPEPLEKEHKD